MDTNKVWYVTGASRGLGLSLVKKLLAAGYRVAATSRSANELQQAAGVDDPSRFLPLKVDLTSADAIRDSIGQTVAAFGALDVKGNGRRPFRISDRLPDQGFAGLIRKQDCRLPFCPGLEPTASLPETSSMRSKIVRVGQLSNFTPGQHERFNKAI
jgi:hypothetical protein